MILISVIVPIYNAEHVIKRGINCLLNQSFKNIEIILVNDGSNDNSGVICDEIAKENKLVKVIHKQNGGAGSARNTGIKIASGEYIMFFDIDDFISFNMIEELYQAAIKEDYDLVICSHKDVTFKENELKVKRINKINEYDISNAKLVRQKYIELFKQGIIQAPWAKLYKTTIIKENNIYFPDLRRCQDIIFNIDYYQYINRLKVISNNLYCYSVPSTDIYLNKFPVEMFSIFKYVNKYIKNRMFQWEELHKDNLDYLNKIMMNETFLSLRLCENSTWKMTREQKKIYIINILEDDYVKECFNQTKPIGIYAVIYLLIKYKLSILCIYINKLSINVNKIFPKLSSFFKK